MFWVLMSAEHSRLTIQSTFRYKSGAKRLLEKLIPKSQNQKSSSSELSRKGEAIQYSKQSLKSQNSLGDRPLQYPGYRYPKQYNIILLPSSLGLPSIAISR